MLEQASRQLFSVAAIPPVPASQPPQPSRAPGSPGVPRASSPPRPPGAVPRIIVQLISHSSLLVQDPNAGRQLDMYYNLTVLGSPGGPQGQRELDVNLALGVLQASGSGTVLLQNLLLVNMAPDPSAYPEGILTCLPWFMQMPGQG